MNSTLNRVVIKTYEKFTGRKILTTLDELNRTQWLSRDELQALQQAKLKRLINYAHQFVPYYQRVFKQLGFDPRDLDHNPELFYQLPILNKAIIRENWSDMLTTEPDHRKHMSRLSTSGSTGQPLIFMQDSAFRNAVTADIQRHIGWAGWKLGELQALIWGASIKKGFYPTLRAELIDFVWNRFQTNAFHMTEQTMIAFADRIVCQKPVVLFGYATSLHHFAQFIQQSKYKGITFKGIFTSAEQLLPTVREYLEETFACKVYNRYGTLELGGVACECEAHTGLHVSMENNFVEILNNGKPAQSGEIGDFVVTNLNNLGMPFIRYSVGDGGAWRETDTCPCGRNSALLKSVEGRKVSSFETRDGRIVWSGFAGAAFRCLAHPAISQFQIIQKSLDCILVRLVKKEALPQVVLNEIQYAMQYTYGENVEVKFEFVDYIEPLPSGKHQYAISEIKDH